MSANVLDLNRNYLNTSPIVNEFFNSYKSPETLRSYKHNLKSFFNVSDVNLITNHMIKKITLTDIQNYIIKLSAQKKSLSTAKQQINCLRSFYNEALDKNIINENPFTHNRAINKLFKTMFEKRIKKNIHVLTNEEIAELLNSIPFFRDKVMIGLMFRSGLRREEISILKWNDIKFNNIKNSWYIEIIGKGNKERRIPLNTKMVEELKEYGKNIFGELGNENPANIFGMSKSNINRIFDKYCNNFDLKPHDTRRNYATKLAQNNMSISEIQELLGHANIKTTQDYLYINNIENKDMDEYIDF